LGAYGKRSNIDQVCLAILSKKNHRGWLLKHIIPGFSDDLVGSTILKAVTAEFQSGK